MSLRARELAGIDAVGQADLVRRGEATPLELVDAAIERIEALDGRLNAVVVRTFEAAREAAAAPGARTAWPFAGVPFLVKDLGMPMAGVRQTAGSVALANHVAPADSEMVRRIRAAGLILLGATNSPEFGNMSTTEPVLFGPTRNPWDLDRTVGGSSGGSSAAVAAGLVPAAMGSDGAGSIRIPASACGTFGMKTSRGRITHAPAGEPLSGLAVSGPITRTVRDNAAILDAVAGRDPDDSLADLPHERPFLEEVGREPGRLRIGFTDRPPFETPVDEACATAVRETAALLASLGHDVEEAAPEIDGETIIGTLGGVWAADNARSVRAIERELGRKLGAGDLEETTWELVRYGSHLSGVDLLDALDALAAAGRRIAGFYDRYDVWLTPTLAREPLPIGVLNRPQGPGLAWWAFDCAFNPWNPVANIAGLPAMSVPLAWTSGGLPIGSLFTGRFGAEATLYRLAGQLEAARPWAGRLPPVWAGAEA